MSKHQSVCLYLPPDYYCISPLLYYYVPAFAGFKPPPLVAVVRACCSLRSAGFEQNPAL